MKQWHWLVLAFMLAAGLAPGRAQGPAGDISASPNPCAIPPGAKECTTYIRWLTRGVSHAKVFVSVESRSGKKEERDFGNTLSCEGEKCRAPWIERNAKYTFMLYDFSSGRRGQMLSSVVVTAR